jgi:hypothetical protein
LFDSYVNRYLLGRMLEWNVVSWNTIISMIKINGKENRAWGGGYLLYRMLEWNTVSWKTIISVV